MRATIISNCKAWVRVIKKRGLTSRWGSLWQQRSTNVIAGIAFDVAVKVADLCAQRDDSIGEVEFGFCNGLALI